MDEIKRKRGRPKKVVDVKQIVSLEPKKRGRPRKIPLEAETIKKPRGRPRKDSVPVVKVVEPEKSKFFQSPQAVFAKHDVVLNTPSINFKTGKLIGYCPNCNMFIMSLDQHGSKFECPKCGVSGEVSTLNKESAIRDEVKHRTKKEYLDNCIAINEDHSESYAAKSPEVEIEKIIDPKILKKEVETDDGDHDLPSDNKE